MEFTKTEDMYLFADEFNTKIEEIVRYNGVPNQHKPMRIGGIDILRGIYRSNFNGENVMLYDVDNNLRAVFFIGLKPTIEQVDLLDDMKVKIIFIDLIYGIDVMSKKLHNGRIPVDMYVPGGSVRGEIQLSSWHNTNKYMCASKSTKNEGVSLFNSKLVVNKHAELFDF